MWSIKNDLGLRSHVIDFKLEQKVDDLTLDGRSVKTMFIKQDSRLIEQQFGVRVNTTIIWDFYPNRLELRMSANNVTAKSEFRKQ